MADKEFEDDDPMELVAVAYPAEPGVDHDGVMARCFIEEYALMGMPRVKVFQLFKAPFFAGTHAILERRGPEFVERLMDEIYGPSNVEEAS